LRISSTSITQEKDIIDLSNLLSRKGKSWNSKGGTKEQKRNGGKEERKKGKK
jgi:hypothetical protein